MKKISLYSLFFVLLTILITSCVKNEEIVYTGRLAEIDAATWNANSGGVTYPILTRRVPDNRPVSTSVDSTLRRLNGSTRVRINLVGPQSTKDETVGYKIFSSPIATISFPATISGQTPSAAAANLAVSNAVAGTHYAALLGKVTIPANSSFGFIDISILNPGSTAGQARFLGIQLDSTGTILPSPNYNKVGLVIDQR
jgi:hypothetical protein